MPKQANQVIKDDKLEEKMRFFFLFSKKVVYLHFLKNSIYIIIII